MSCFTFFRFFFIQFSRYTPAVSISRCLYGALCHCGFVWLLAVRIFSFRDYVSFDSQFLKRGLLPVQPVVGSNGLEPSTSRLSGVRSNHLSYEPMFVAVRCHFLGQPVCLRLVLYPFRDYVSFDSQFLKRVLLGAAVVEMNRIELSTPCLQGRCSPS